MLRQTSGSVVCPNCGRLVGVRDDKCFNCGRPYPGLFGFAPWLNRLGQNFGFAEVVIWGCGFMYVVSLLLNLDAALSMGSILSILSPGGNEVFLLGMSGAQPIFGYGRWWTVLSAAWLHGGIIHIGFNLYYLRFLVPQVDHVMGLGRTILIYTAGSAVGFLGTSTTYFVLVLLESRDLLPAFVSNALGFLGFAGAPATLGASASLCGLIGGLYAYAQASGSRAGQEGVKRIAIFLLLFGILVPRVDNMGHIFGFIGGYLAAKLLKPLEEETPLHMLAAGICLLLFLASIIASVVHGWPIYQATRAVQ